MTDLSAHCPKCGEVEEIDLTPPVNFTIRSEYLTLTCDACEDSDD